MTTLYEETVAADIAQLIVKKPMTNAELSYLIDADRSTITATIHKMRNKYGIAVHSSEDGFYRLNREDMPAIEKPFYLRAYIMLLEAGDWIDSAEIVNALDNKHGERSIRDCVCRNMGVSITMKKGPNKEKLWRLVK